MQSQLSHPYDIGLSFAGEQRDYVRSVADFLVSRGFRVFFDDYERTGLWGKDLYAHLSDIYQNQCQYCVIFVSKEYAKKVWTNHERRNAQARALRENSEYILPARFDDTPIDGLTDTTHYVDLSGIEPAELGKVVAEKVVFSRLRFVPEVFDLLYEALEDEEAKEFVHLIAYRFLNTLRRMTQAERRVVLTFIQNACAVELPHNLHTPACDLAVLTGMSPDSLRNVLRGLHRFGFTCYVSTRLHDGREQFILDWNSEMDERHIRADLTVARDLVENLALIYRKEYGANFLDVMVHSGKEL